MKVKYLRLFDFLRLILLIIVLSQYYSATINLWKDFDKTIFPLAKNYFHFIKPTAVSGESDVFDFVTFYASGLLNRERITKYPDLDVYDPVLLTQTVDRLLAPMQSVETFSIQYPPLLFALTTPLTYFDLYTGWRIWFFLSAMCITIAFVCIAFAALKKRAVLLIGFLMCMANIAVAGDLSLGQTTAFEIAIIALSLRLLINRNYWWAGLIAGASFFKPQQALIALIPGICLGKRNFVYGCILAVTLEILLSAYIVGYDNLFNFIKANYLCEIKHSYVGLNHTWFMTNFRSLLCSLNCNMPGVNVISALAYVSSGIASGWVWLKLYPALQKVSGQAFELAASLSTIMLVYFSMHGYLYDLLLLLIPILWLYIWSTTDDTQYTPRQSVIRLFISLATLLLPLLIRVNLDLLSGETINVSYHWRCFLGIIIFLFCAIAAVIIELKQAPPVAAIPK